MTRKDYLVISSAIRRWKTTNEEKRVFVDTIGDSLACDNKYFDRDRFVEACCLTISKDLF